MRLAEICIERPVFASVLSLIIIVLGFIGFFRMDTRYFPQVAEPYAQVSVHYDGASPDVMESQVTQFLENSLINVSGVVELRSTSTNNYSYIYLTFAPDADLNKVMGDVRNAVSSASSLLPTDAEPANITLGGVERPVLNIGFIDPDLNSSQIRDYVSQAVVPQFINLPGMGGVWLYGADTYALRIWMEPQKMASLGVTATDIKNTLQANNIDFSGGSIQGPQRNYPIVANTELHDVSQFANMIIREQNGEAVKLRDVARVELGSRSIQDSPMRINGQPGIDMELRPLNSANPITVAKEAKAALKEIKKKLPSNMQVLITYDQSQFLQGAIHESFIALFEAVALVALVVYLFLGSLRAAIIPVTTIPVCVMGAFGIMLFCGFSINVMSLLAIILAIGLVVDDAIVVLENIHRHIELGLTPLHAAFKGVKEIGFSVIAMTLTLAAVYAPTGFTTGFTATVFREFAFTLAGAVLISGFVALTLSPMMCSRVLRAHNQEIPRELKIEKLFANLNGNYAQFLNWLLARKRWIGLSLAGLAVVGYFFYFFLPQEFIPKEDIGYFQVNINPPPGSSINYTDAYMQALEKVYSETPQILSYASFIFAGNATNFVTMQPWGKRKRSTQDILERLQPQFDNLPILVDVNIPDPIDYGLGTDGKEIQVHIMTLGSYNDLANTVSKLLLNFQKYPGMENVTTNLRFDNQIYQLAFNRDAAANLGVNLQDVADTVSTMLGGKHTTDIQRGNQAYNVLVQMDLQDLKSFQGLNNIYVRNSQGVMIPLSNLVTLTPAVRQSNLYRYDRMPSADISAELVPHHDISTVANYINKTMTQLLPSNDQYRFGGVIQAYEDSSGTMLYLFALSLIFIYLVLAAQFESFVDPFIILLTVPLCIVGALATLKITGGSLNLYTNIGLITLVGLVSKHGILITQFANVRLRAGDNLLTAVREAAIVRLRPILMTTSAMVLGAVPLAFDHGPGSISHQQIGWILVGGLLFGTIFSLAVVPIAYYVLSPWDHKKKRLIAQHGSV